MSRYSTIGNPPSGSVADAKKEVFDAMDDEEQKFLFGIADELTLLVKESGDYAAATYLGNQRLDTDETIALFWLLRSDVRAAIKRGQKKE